mgnify:CR=1 FL=1
MRNGVLTAAGVAGCWLSAVTTGWPPSPVTALLVAAAALAVSVVLARRYRELRTALVSTGVLKVEQIELSTQPSDGSFLPAVGSRIPAGIQATATDGTVIDNGYLAGRLATAGGDWPSACMRAVSP